MIRSLILAGLLLLGFRADVLAQGRGRPAPPPSRYGYSLHVEASALPDGVSVRRSQDNLSPRLFLKNASDVPLVINERFENERLVAGTKLVGGKVYQYFPNGVPMEGKTHLKGWQAPFGDIPETLLSLPKEPAKIYEGREAGLSKDLPPPESISIPARYDGKPYEIKGEIRYHLNDAYDAFYRAKDTPAAAADFDPQPTSWAGAAGIWAEIKVIDGDTGRGLPLVELETVNGLTFVTDNAGRVAFHEPGLIGKQIFFSVKSHGYETPKDGFGIAGVRVTPEVGQIAEIKLKRQNLAERLCRLTGEGLYRDSRLLGYETPLPAESLGRVAGQDSVQTAEYNGRVFWFWGDTQRMSYALGLFRMAGATTPRFDPLDPNSDPAGGIRFDYFVDEKGFARATMPLPERPEGVVWVGALCVVPDANGKERLAAHYSRRKGLAEELEQGIAVWNDGLDIFEVAKQLPLEETWRRPNGHPIIYEDDRQKWLLFGSPSPNVRVPANYEALLDATQYEAFVPAGDAWGWQKELPPVDSQQEHERIKSGKLPPESARFCPRDAENKGKRIVLHRGSVRWNEHRQRWVLIAGQYGGKESFIGEVWYAEAKQPTGPFSTAVKVVTHDRQSFYNPCHHAFLDRDGGRVIHFEGTYTNDFSGNPHKTPRYNYNQVLYRLDLDAPELAPARVE
jgi:hypothetical protein